MKSSSAATPVTISGVTSGIRVTAPTARPRRERDPLQAEGQHGAEHERAERRDGRDPQAGRERLEQRAVVKKSEYHRVLKPENTDSDFSELKLNSATATIGR